MMIMVGLVTCLGATRPENDHFGILRVRHQNLV